jgi:hypothetical protein
MAHHGSSTSKINGHWFFDENGLAAIKRRNCDLSLQTRRRGNGNRVDRGMLDQFTPFAKCLGNTGLPGELGGAGWIGSCQRYYSASRVEAECRQLYCEAVVATDNADADHNRSCFWM